MMPSLAAVLGFLNLDFQKQCSVSNRNMIRTKTVYFACVR